MKWNQLLPKTKALLERSPVPNVICIHLGGNDLVSTPLRKLTKQAQRDINTLAKLCPQTVLFWSDILARVSYRNAESNSKMEKPRKTLNSAMRAHTRKNGVKSIRHPPAGINWNMPHLCRNDGVHLNDLGNDILLENLQEGIHCFERSPNRREFPIQN
jgi:lysophospholipase L1-like esterase